MNKRQKKRLLNVAKALRESRFPEEFNMGHFGNPALTYSNHKCGTPACALGNYAARLDLQKAFKLDRSGDLVGRNDEELFLDGAWHEVVEHFGITQGEAYELFNWDGCNMAQSVEEAAEYIEAFVERHS